MEVKKLQLIPAVLYVIVMTATVASWAMMVLLAVARASLSAFFLSLLAGAIMNTARKRFGFTAREALVIDPVIYHDAKVVWAPGDYDFKIEENVNKYSGSKRYVVLVRPLGRHGFTFIKDAVLVNGNGSDVQEQLLDLQIVNPEAVKAVVGMMKKEIRKEQSDYWHVEYREKKIKEYEELFLS